MNISKNSLDIVKKLIIDLDVEACGFFIEQKDTPELELYIEAYGETKDGRNFCRHSSNHKYIWHTHSHISKAYPSVEDILKIIKKRDNDNPKASLIFTIWGIWILHANKKITLGEKWFPYLPDKLKPFLHELYEKTGKGRETYTSNSIQNFINGIQGVINNKLPVGLEIQFHPW